VHVGSGVCAGGVTVFPVWTALRGPRGVDTGVRARVGVAERAGSPVVGELVLTNDGPRPALLLDGELLEGGWQHRTVVGDLVLDPGSSRVVDVACVEVGRWSGAAGHGRRARRAPVTVRSALGREQGARQGAVWARVGDYETVGDPSPTGSLLDHLDGVTGTPAHPGAVLLPGQRGVILGVGGQPVLLELFGSGTALAAHLPGMLAAAALDAALVPPTHRGEVPGRRARRMVTHLQGIGLGVDPTGGGDGVALGGDTSHAALRGVALSTGELAHLSVLNTHHPLLEMA
jgi:hypothetical protein